MIPHGVSYEEAMRQFRWPRPPRFNIGRAVCERHPSHALALIGVAYVLVVAGAVCSLSIAFFISTLTDSSLTAAIIAVAVFTQALNA